MKTRLSPAMIGGCIGIAYFLITLGSAHLFGGDTEGTMVIAQLMNLHVAAFFALLEAVFPPSAPVYPGSLLFELLIGCILNFLLGGLIGALVGRLRRKI